MREDRGVDFADLVFNKSECEVEHDTAINLGILQGHDHRLARVGIVVGRTVLKQPLLHLCLLFINYPVQLKLDECFAVL